MERLVLLTVMGATVGLWTAWAGDNVWTSLGPDGGGARSLVIDPLNANTVYALTSAGLFKSTDGGANWRATPLLQPKPGVVTSLVIDPHNSSTLYATGTEAWGKGVRAVLKSTDEGASWRVLTAVTRLRGSRPSGDRPRRPEHTVRGRLQRNSQERGWRRNLEDVKRRAAGSFTYIRWRSTRKTPTLCTR